MLDENRGESTTTQRYPVWVRAYAITLVLFVHVSGALVGQVGRIRDLDWWVADFVDAFARPGAPLFFMLSGALLLGKHESVQDFFRKRLVRVGVPFLVWACLYLGWRSLYYHELWTLGSAIREILAGPVFAHFWFFYVLITLYLLTPLLRVFVRAAHPTEKHYLVVLWLVAGSLVPMLKPWLHLTVGFTQALEGLGYVGYFVLGYELRWLIPDRTLTQRLLGIVAIGTLFTALATGLLNWSMPTTLNDVFYSNLSPNVIAMTIATFLLLKRTETESLQWLAAPAKLLSTASFTLFLVHLIPLNVMLDHWHSLTNLLNFQPIVGIPLLVAITLGVSLLYWVAMSQIPYLGKLLAP